jgi:large subunit ribosomal protein L19
MSNVSPILAFVEQSTARETPLPTFRAGDTIRVHVMISEGSKQRIQMFEGVCIHRKAGGRRRSFTVRKISHGVGVERVFPVHSPYVEQIEVERSAHVRRAKLYYQRKRTGKKARLKEKIITKK